MSSFISSSTFSFSWVSRACSVFQLLNVSFRPLGFGPRFSICCARDVCFDFLISSCPFLSLSASWTEGTVIFPVFKVSSSFCGSSISIFVNWDKSPRAASLLSSILRISCGTPFKPPTFIWFARMIIQTSLAFSCAASASSSFLSMFCLSISSSPMRALKILVACWMLPASFLRLSYACQDAFGTNWGLLR